MSTKFNQEWLSKEEYKRWLMPVPEDMTKAKCRLCSKTFLLSNMGEIAIKSHASGKKHKTTVTHAYGIGPVSDFFKFKKDQQPEMSMTLKFEEPSTSLLCGTEVRDMTIPPPPQQVQSTLRQQDVGKHALRKEQHKAEGLWALKCVMSHFFFNSTADITDIFRAMFPDSAIAIKMSCGPNKMSYLICFGIAPYFRQLLLAELKETP